MRFGMIFAMLSAALTPKTATHKLRRPGYLPTIARDLLDSRMKSHGRDVMQVSVAVVLLEYDDALAAAQSIADEPGVVRVPAGDDTLNASLPKRFFDLQDELHARAQDLVGTIKKHDDKAIAVAYSRMTETCIACHSVYLKGQEDPIDLNH